MIRRRARRTWPSARRARPSLPQRHRPTATRRREELGRRRYRVAQRAKPPDSAYAAEKLDPRASLEPLESADDDRADLAGPADMRAAARREIEVLDIDQAERPLSDRLLAKRQLR